jgi:hypothetical protein
VPDDPAPRPLVAFASAVVVLSLGLLAVGWIGSSLVAGRGGADDHGTAVTNDGMVETQAGAQLGASSDGYGVWERNADGTPVRWDPCRPIELVVDADAPTWFRDELEVATATLADATGLTLRTVGPTDERPRADRSPYDPGRYGERWAPVLVAWAQPHDGGLPLRDIDRAIAIPVAVGAPGDRTYVSGQVVFNRDRDDLRPGFDDRATSWGATVLHELAHLLGLAHVDDEDELMATHPGVGPVELGAGDLAGLAAVGADGGCRSVPEPGPVRVTGPPH